MEKHITIWWLRQDLRVADNAALTWAAARGKVLPVYIWDETSGRMPGGAGKWWLERSLKALGKMVPVVLRTGKIEAVLQELIAEVGADAVCWNRCYEPWAVHRDKDLKALLRDEGGVDVQSFNSALLHEPWEVKTLGGTEFKVFTPYWKAALKLAVEAPCPVPEVAWVKGVESEDLQLYPVAGEPDWAKGWEDLWVPGEAGAVTAMKVFLAEKQDNYSDGRDRPAADLTSKLSAHLHFGEIGPRQVFALAQAHKGLNTDKFLSEIGWREFAHHLLYYYPTMVDTNWKRAFDRYPWRKLEGKAAADFEAWKRGETGYPLVDAGMRQLWQTGWMHNRIRMVTASFLIKHLQIDWREGEKWFWETLVDADAANNVAGWQWVAGSGADASPYFRIFNPTTQAEKFDPDAEYIRRYCPELRALDNKDIFAPWAAPEVRQRAAGIDKKSVYAAPIVGHEQARAAALAGYEKVRGEE